ncbi:MAG: 23S rRNA pseudouridine(1911/1915/1917) synthase RluD, partial [Burkholderiales bacterium]|nr:23S rRNA pseudouridine(1911/1915/1917) synthase RluD [Burkholderiales bacterium]
SIPNEVIWDRLDLAISNILKDYSRTKITQWIKNGNVLVNKMIIKPKVLVYGGEVIEIYPEPFDLNSSYVAEDIPLSIIYEDNDIIIINKPAGLVVHPGNGNWSNTLLNGLLFYCPSLKNVPRAGIVHRLDKGTSGLMVVAKTIQAQLSLVKQLQNRTVTRLYRAIVEGHPNNSGIVNKNIGRHPQARIKMAALNIGGKEAITHYKVIEYFDKYSYIECKLETGRTHQIRVHMKHIGFSLLGDQTYGTNKPISNPAVADCIKQMNRQILHAFKLKLLHPTTNKEIIFKSNLPDDFKYLLTLMQENEEQTNDKIVDDEFDDFDDQWEIIYAEE